MLNPYLHIVNIFFWSKLIEKIKKKKTKTKFLDIITRVS